MSFNVSFFKYRILRLLLDTASWTQLSELYPDADITVEEVPKSRYSLLIRVKTKDSGNIYYTVKVSEMR